MQQLTCTASTVLAVSPAAETRDCTVIQYKVACQQIDGMTSSRWHVYLDLWVRVELKSVHWGYVAQLCCRTASLAAEGLPGSAGLVASVAVQLV
jgi:hypothetical protein